MIELKILIDEIDYDSVADFLVPLLVEKLKKEDRTASHRDHQGWEFSYQDRQRVQCCRGIAMRACLYQTRIV